MRVVKVAICDDDEFARNRAQEYLKNYFSTKGYDKIYKIEYYLFDDGINCFLTYEHYDIAILDARMKKFSGFVLREKLKERRVETQFIFLSDFKNLFREAQGYNVVGFVWKEEIERLSIYLDVIMTNFYSNGVIELDGDMVELAPVVYIQQTFGHTVFFDIYGGKTDHTILMDALTKKLKSNRQMQRISPSIMINYEYACNFKIKEQELTLHVPEEIPDTDFQDKKFVVKPLYKEEVRQGYFDYLRKKYLNE